MWPRAGAPSLRHEVLPPRDRAVGEQLGHRLARPSHVPRLVRVSSSEVLIRPHPAGQRKFEAFSPQAVHGRARRSMLLGTQRLWGPEATRDTHANSSQGTAVSAVARVDAREPVSREVVEPKSRVVPRGAQERRKPMAVVIGRVAVREHDSKPRREKLRHCACVENTRRSRRVRGSHPAPRKPLARASGVRLRTAIALRPLGEPQLYGESIH